MKYKVTYRIDSLDTNPDIEYFDDQHEMFAHISEEVGRRVDFAVFTIRKDLEVTEYSLVRIDEL